MRYLNGSMLGVGDSSNSPNLGAAPGIWTPDDINRQKLLMGLGISDRAPLNYEWVTPGSDPNFASVSVLCHFDRIVSGANAYAFLNTGSGPNVEPHGGAKLSCGQTKFGVYSCLMNTAAGGSTSTYLGVPTGSGTNFGTGDFTVEFWAFFGNTSNAGVFDMRPSEPSVAPLISVSPGGGPAGSLGYRVNGSLVINGAAISASAWHHIALSRASGSTKMFLDGTQYGSTYADANSYLANQTAVFGNVNLGLALSACCNGLYLQELRITKGVGRYTANFTAPTERFTDF